MADNMNPNTADAGDQQNITDAMAGLAVDNTAAAVKEKKSNDGASDAVNGATFGPAGSNERLRERRELLRRQESTHRTADEDGDAEMKEETGAEADRRKFDHPVIFERMQSIEDQQKSDMDVFIKWLKDNGAAFPSLYFKCYSESVRGVHASKDIPSYQQIMAIPLKCLITDDTGRRTPLGQRLETVRHQLTVPNHCQVIVYMMMGRDAGNSWFQPYYDTLPKDFNNFPIFWAEEEMAWLEGSALVHQIAERKRNIRSDYDTICKCLPEFSKFTFPEFLWCRTAVGSRNFSIVVNGEKRTAMVPMADMLNHYRPRETSWTYDNSQGAFTMTSLTKLTAHNQVMDSYGKKCNSKFLMHYGFTIESNREADGKCQNELELNLKLDEKDALFEKRSYYVSKQRTYRGTMNHEDRGTSDTLAYLRVAAANEEELSTFSRGFQHSVISADNESRALLLLAKFATEKLNNYPTTIEQDNKELEDDKLDPFCNRRHAIIVVRGEKEICHFFIALAQAATAVLKLPPAERKVAVREKFSDQTDISLFITAVHRALMCKGL